MDPETMAERLRAARVKKGYSSASQAAEAFGWTRSTYISHENGTRAFGIDEAKRYARALGVNPGWLLALETLKPTEVTMTASLTMPFEELPVRSSVAAGVWLEHIEWPEDEWYEIDVGPPPYPGAERFAVQMEGTSMNLLIPPGSALECARVIFGKIEPSVGDVVIAERRRNGLTELTCKRLGRDGEEWVLRCESSDPRYRDVMLRVGEPDADSVTQDEAVIVGIVLSAQQRHFRRPREK